MTLRNFNKPMLQPDGKPYREAPEIKRNEKGEVIQGNDGRPEVIEGKIVNISASLYNCLLAQAPGETATAMQKYQRAQCAAKVIKDDEQDYTAEELVTMKDIVGKLASPGEVLAIFDAIDGKDEKPASVSKIGDKKAEQKETA